MIEPFLSIVGAKTNVVLLLSVFFLDVFTKFSHLSIDSSLRDLVEKATLSLLEDSCKICSNDAFAFGCMD